MRSICQALTADHCSLVHMRVALFRVCVSSMLVLTEGRSRGPNMLSSVANVHYIFIISLVRYVYCPRSSRRLNKRC
jgi:hypothetical protein